MSPKGYMILGAIAGLTQFVAASVFPLAYPDGFAVFVFAAGAIFGKGYGIWEERSHRRPLP